MAIENRANLKAHFNRGKIPQEENFFNLIESNLNLHSGESSVVEGNITFSNSITATNGMAGASFDVGPGLVSTEGTINKGRVTNINNEIITTFQIDLTGLKSYHDDGDVIGRDGIAGAYLMQYKTADHGILYKTEISCIELPTASSNVLLDFDLFLFNSADKEGDNDLAAAGLAIHTGGGNIAIGTTIQDLTAGDTSDKNHHYVYLASGNTHGGASVFTAGKLIVKLYGHATF